MNIFCILIFVTGFSISHAMENQDNNNSKSSFATFGSSLTRNASDESDCKRKKVDRKEREIKKLCKRFMYYKVLQQKGTKIKANIADILMHQLDLSECEIRNLHKDLKKIVGIYEDQYGWVKLTKELKNKYTIHELDLTGNNLEKLPDSLVGTLSCITKVGLAKNRFKQIPNVLIFSKKIEEVDVSDNQLKEVDFWVIEDWQKLKKLTISGNEGIVISKELSAQVEIKNIQLINEAKQNRVKKQ